MLMLKKERREKTQKRRGCAFDLKKEKKKEEEKAVMLTSQKKKKKTGEQTTTTKTQRGFDTDLLPAVSGWSPSPPHSACPRCLPPAAPATAPAAWHAHHPAGSPGWPAPAGAATSASAGPPHRTLGLRGNDREKHTSKINPMWKLVPCTKSETVNCRVWDFSFSRTSAFDTGSVGKWQKKTHTRNKPNVKAGPAHWKWDCELWSLRLQLQQALHIGHWVCGEITGKNTHIKNKPHVKAGPIHWRQHWTVESAISVSAGTSPSTCLQCLVWVP